MDVASLDKARQLMRMQKEGDRHLNIRPAFVLVPTALESVSNQVIKSVSVKGADINAGIINPVKDFATVIAEPRLDDASQSTFYLTAAKGSDTIEVAYGYRQIKVVCRKWSVKAGLLKTTFTATFEQVIS